MTLQQPHEYGERRLAPQDRDGEITVTIAFSNDLREIHKKEPDVGGLLGRVSMTDRKYAEGLNDATRSGIFGEIATWLVLRREYKVIEPTREDDLGSVDLWANTEKFTENGKPVFWAIQIKTDAYAEQTAVSVVNKESEVGVRMMRTADSTQSIPKGAFVEPILIVIPGGDNGMYNTMTGLPLNQMQKELSEKMFDLLDGIDERLD